MDIRDPMDEDEEDEAAAGGASDSTAAATLPELAAGARPVSVSRFSRFRSARISEALW